MSRFSLFFPSLSHSPSLFRLRASSCLHCGAAVGLSVRERASSITWQTHTAFKDTNRRVNYSHGLVVCLTRHTVYTFGGVGFRHGLAAVDGAVVLNCWVGGPNVAHEPFLGNIVGRYNLFGRAVRHRRALINKMDLTCLNLICGSL